MSDYDAILIVSFGGPEKPDDVLPFLEHVVRGRNVSSERLQEVAGHYYHFGGRSPLNDQVRQLLSVLREELDRHDIRLPLFWGNRNWHPFLTETLRAMTQQRIRRALAVVLSAYSSYSSCRQYLENIEHARAAAGENAPLVDKVRPFFNHPQFIAANAERLRDILQSVPAAERSSVHVAYTAHSIPLSMARTCRYEEQLTETARLVSEAVGLSPEQWRLVYQSRSGPPAMPWLEPDICDYLRTLSAEGKKCVVLSPIGFLSDHLEVLYDLDVEAQQVAEETGLQLLRAKTVGTHPRFVTMLRELIEERLNPGTAVPAVGQYPPLPHVCPSDCCPPPPRRASSRR